MPDPGSHEHDIRRTRLRDEHENVEGVPDQRADRAANQQLQQQYPPRRADDDRAAGPLGQRPSGTSGRKGRGRDARGGGIQLRSSTFADHDLLPRKCSRDGGDIAPDLEWDGVPDEAAELAVVCVDPDAPHGPFLHWMVSGLSPFVDHVHGGRPPEAATESRNDFGETGWSGPSPPVGDDAHRYFFRVYASDRPLALTVRSTLQDLHESLQESELARGTIVGLYQR